MRLFAVCALLVLMGVVSVHADVIPYTDPALQGTQDFGGNLALRFNVDSPITVTALGAFNAAGSGLITGTIQVVIFDTVANKEVTPVVSFHGLYSTAGLGYDVFQAITPVVLGVGSYEVDAVGFSLTDLNGNLNTSSTTGPVLNDDGGKLTFTGAAYDGSGSLDDPMTCVICSPPPRQFSQVDAGTFVIAEASAAPEPSYLLVLVVLGAILAAIRFRSDAFRRPL
jgi:hypothetical protein